MAVEYGKWEKIERKRIIPFTVEENVMIRGWWSADKEGKEVIDKAFLEDTVYFHIEMMGIPIQDGEKLSLQLYDYDHFLWFDIYNLDDKIENPKECIIKEGKALLEVYLKPQWKEHIEDDLGSSIELYWKVKYIKKDKRELTINLPKEERDYLKVSNNRDIYIKPVIDDRKINYGIPEIYDYNGNPMLFTIIQDIQEERNVRIGMEDYVKGFSISGVLYTTDKVLPNISKGIAITKLNAGYRVTHSGKMRYHQYLKDFSTSNVIVRDKLIKHMIPDYWYETRGLDHVAGMQKKLASTNTLYFIKNFANMFDSLTSLVELTKGGKDINSVLTDVLTLAGNTNPFLAILTKMTVDVLATPAKEFIDDWKEDDERNFLQSKILGINSLKKMIQTYNNIKIKSAEPYFLADITLEVMQALLEGKIRNRKDLKIFEKKYSSKVQYSTDKALMLCKENDNFMIIDSFFINK